MNPIGNSWGKLENNFILNLRRKADFKTLLTSAQKLGNPNVSHRLKEVRKNSATVSFSEENR